MDVRSALFVVFIASLGPARGSIIVDGPSNDLEPTCPYENIPGTLFDVPYTLMNAQFECYKPTSTFLMEVNFASTTSDYQRIFQRACVQAPKVKACIADVGRDADVCLTPLEKKLFLTVRHFVEHGVEETCAEGSEKMAHMYGDELKPMDFASQVRVLSCVNAMHVKTAYQRETDLPGYTLRRYRAISDVKECVRNVARRKLQSIDHFEDFIDQMMSKMECIHPNTEEVVLCSSLGTQDHA